jgi:serine/threonine protein kinase
MANREIFHPIHQLTKLDVGTSFESLTGWRYTLTDQKTADLQTCAYRARALPPRSEPARPAPARPAPARDVFIKAVFLPPSPNKIALDLFDRISLEYDILGVLRGVRGVPARIELMTIPHSGSMPLTSLLSCEWQDGTVLSEVLSSSPQELRELSVLELVDLCRNLIEILAMIHDRKVMHNDIKPPNIIYHADRGFSVVDYNVAKVEGDPDRTVVRYTPAYAAPERTSGEVSFASDVYSLGIVLASILLAREISGDSSTPPNLESATDLQIEISDLLSSRRDIKQHLCDAVTRAVSPKPQDRYPTARDLLREFVVEVHVSLLESAARRHGISLNHWDLAFIEEELEKAHRNYGKPAVSDAINVIITCEKALATKQPFSVEVLKKILYSMREYVMKSHGGDLYFGFRVLLEYIKPLCDAGVLERPKARNFLFNEIIKKEPNILSKWTYPYVYKNFALEVVRSLYIP